MERVRRIFPCLDSFLIFFGCVHEVVIYPFPIILSHFHYTASRVLGKAIREISRLNQRVPGVFHAPPPVLKKHSLFFFYLWIFFRLQPSDLFALEMSEFGGQRNRGTRYLIPDFVLIIFSPRLHFSTKRDRFQ